MPQDLLFEQNVHPNDTDVVTPAEYAAELKTHLSEVYQNVAHNLGLNQAGQLIILYITYHFGNNMPKMTWAQ